KCLFYPWAWFQRALRESFERSQVGEASRFAKVADGSCRHRARSLSSSLAGGQAGSSGRAFPHFSDRRYRVLRVKERRARRENISSRLGARGGGFRVDAAIDFHIK